MTKTETKANAIDLAHLVNAIDHTNQFFLDRVQKQVNKALTVRNWVIGFYIAEYEQLGEDRAIYGNKMLENLAKRLKQKGYKGMAETNLKLFRQFYQCYPQIRQSLPDQFELSGFQHNTISQTVTDEFEQGISTTTDLLLNRLSFTHIVELIKADSPHKTNILRD